MSQASAGATLDGATEEQVRLRLEGLQHEVEKSATLVRRLGFLAILLVSLLVFLIIALHLYHVMQYAEVASVEAITAGDRIGTAVILYTPRTAGKIEFVRESDGLLQTLTEYARDPSSSNDPEERFTWSDKDEKSQLRVTYRKGLFLVTKDLSAKGYGRGN